MKLSEGLNISGSEIKNIIFDWGGVLTDLHFEKTIGAFHALGFRHFEESFSIADDHSFFLRFEIGKIDEAAFLRELRKHTRHPVSDQQLLDAWNIMLGDFPGDHWRLLENIKSSYRTFLLSNTNSLHISYYFRKLETLYGTYGYSHLFEKVYFSHILGMRKPEPVIYEFVLRDSNLDPSSTLFIDDNPLNIETAVKLGIKGYHLAPPVTLLDIFE
jgi:epoxide hydrolase-like predicted phosphatase